MRRPLMNELALRGATSGLNSAPRETPQSRGNEITELRLSIRGNYGSNDKGEGRKVGAPFDRSSFETRGSTRIHSLTHELYVRTHTHTHVHTTRTHITRTHTQSTHNTYTHIHHTDTRVDA